MPLFHSCRAQLSLPRLAVVFSLLGLGCVASYAQRPKVMAPHQPVAPKLEPRLTGHMLPVRQSAIGGLWMTGANNKASLYLKNGLKTDPITVTPILYLSNGGRYPLPAVTLEPSGTSIVDLNEGLAKQGIAPYGQLFGYAELEYQWPWPAVTATIRNVDQVNSLIFIYALRQPPAVLAQDAAPEGTQTAHNFEAGWWKHEKNVSAFLALANVSERTVNANVRTTDSQNTQLETYSLTISPHSTKMLTLNELLSTKSDVGGVYVSHNGPDHALAINGGLVDQAVGYSAHLSLLPSPQASSQAPVEISLAELGLMSGAADPMMNFPSGTAFTPYSVVRNISDQTAVVTPSLWWMSGGTAQSAQLTAITIAPHRTLTLDVPAIIAATGLKNFNGSVNLELDTRAQPGALALASGSVDQTHTYVFEVIPRGADESASQALCYWSTGNGDDTMITLWNAADEQQDLIFTLFFSGGHYAYPIQLQPRATRTFNISEILHSSNPDAEGNIVPAAVFEGSAEIAGSQGEHQHISVSMDAGVYNVRKAICGNPCVTCNGLVNSFVVTSPFAVAVGASRQQTFYMQYNTGSQFNLNGHSSWSSNATSVATVSAGLVSGIGPGSPTIFAQDNFFEPDFIACATSLRDCSLKTNASRPGGSAPGNVFNGVLTPQDNFSGRSTSRFGIAEVINLSFNAQTTAAALGGLQWTIVSGGGTLTNAGTAGTATYTAPAMAATVVLRIAVASGSSQGQHRDYSIAIITPSGGLESKFSNVRHKQGDVSVGFLAHIFLEPTDVSFANLQFAEGSAPAVASGYFGPLNGHLHPPTSSPVPIGSCDSVIGCEVAATGGDQIDTGDDPPPFSNGDFLWSIPWQYQAPGGALTTFTTVNHHSTAVATSSTAATATIEKGGAGPFSKNSSDPTTTY